MLSTILFVTSIDCPPHPATAPAAPPKIAAAPLVVALHFGVGAAAMTGEAATIIFALTGDADALERGVASISPLSKEACSC